MRSSFQKYLAFLPVIALLFAFAACDSSDDDPTESELFIGSWNLTGVSDADGAVELTAFSSIVVSFSSTTGTITAAPIDGSADQVFTGSYSVDETANTLTLQLTVTGIPTPVPVVTSYSFSGEDRVTLTVDAATAVVLGPLFGTQFSGAVTLTVERI